MSLASALSLLPRACVRRFPLPSVLLAAALGMAAVSPMQAQNPGDLDPTFVSALGATETAGTIYSLFRYDYLDIAGIPRDFLVVGGQTDLFGRLVLQFGSLNTAETPPDFGDSTRIVYTIAQDKYMNPDKFFVGGAFGVSTTQVVPRQNIFRINSDFTLDAPTITNDGRALFDPKAGANGFVTSILPTSDGKLVVGGLFTEFNNISHPYIVRLLDNGGNNPLAIDGAIDPAFDPRLAFDSNVLTLAEQLSPATGQPNGQILVGGLFNNVNGSPATKLARINNDGSVDTTFQPSIDERVNYVTVQPDGKILIGGDFTMINGTAESHLARLNFDGSLDTTFSADVRAVPVNNVDVVSVYTISLLTDGRMYVGGNFIMINGVARQYLALLDADGSVDPSFDPGTNLFASVQAVLPDSTSTGRVYVAETGSARLNDGKFPETVVALYQPTGIAPAFTNAPAPSRIPTFFSGSAPLGNGYYFLQFDANHIFGYYDPEFHPYIYHDGLGFEYATDANDGKNGIYFYDFASGHTFYTSPTFAFPYLYDFTLQSVIYFYPAPDGFFVTNPRLFFDFATGQNVSF